jgi:hypothetical protein
MNPIIKEQVLPLVGKVEMKGFNGGFGSMMSLQNKLIKHTKARNKEKIKMYLAFCIQTWPVFDKCPIDRDMLKEAIEVLRG